MCAAITSVFRGFGVETGDPGNVDKRKNQQRTFKVVFELSGLSRAFPLHLAEPNVRTAPFATCCSCDTYATNEGLVRALKDLLRLAAESGGSEPIAEVLDSCCARSQQENRRGCTVLNVAMQQSNRMTE